MFNLKPNELYELEPDELLEMVSSYIEVKSHKVDEDMQKLAWQTSIIINCMGTLKKKIKPTDLYNPDADVDTSTGVKVIGEEEHKQLQNDLLDAFNR